MVSAHAELPHQTERRPAPSASFLASTSLRLDELVIRTEELRRALRGTRQRTPQATQLAMELLILEAEKASIEGFLKGSAAGR